MDDPPPGLCGRLAGTAPALICQDYPVAGAAAQHCPPGGLPWAVASWMGRVAL